MEESTEGDICRVCRSEGSSDRPLFHPCICTGSIKFIHQDCLLQWLKHSKKEYCELCMHRFSFTPIYSPDMPKRLPVMDIVRGLAKSMGTAVKCWLHYTLVTFAWLGVVPVTACRIYRCLFQASFVPLLTLPFEVFSLESVVTDILQGMLVVGSTLCAFVSLVWLREQVTHGGGPDWLDDDANRAADGAADGVGEDAGAPAGGVAGAGAGAAGAPPAAGAPAAGAPAAGAQAAGAPVAAAGAPAAAAAGAPAAGAYQPQVPAPANNQGAVQPVQPQGNQDVAVDHQALPANQEEVAAVAANGNEEGAEPAAAEVNAAGGGENAGQDDINWNALEWDRAAEELTWERMLGLDGSLIFLEHVLWVISLNALFIFVFAFCPYHIGRFGMLLLGWDELVKLSRFEGLITTMSGYVTLCSSLILFHCFSGLLKLHRTKRILGLCYIVLKVFLLVVTEIGVLPLVCGWWLDICSLSMFDTALQDRLQSFQSAPGTSMFLHWLVGMVYVFYFASFILLLREVLRPGVLWFLRNLNDPDFNPIQEMIHLPIYRHVRRSLLSVIVFGSVVLLVLWLPVTIIKYLFPSFLPYHIHLSSDSPVSELSLELLLLQVVLPALLEQGHTRQWLKNAIRGWTIVAAYLLNMRSYLLGDVPVEDKPTPSPQHDQQLAHLDFEEDGPNPEAAHLNPEDIASFSGEEDLYLGVNDPQPGGSGTQSESPDDDEGDLGIRLNSLLEVAAPQEGSVDITAFTEEEVVSSGRDDDSDVIMEEEEMDEIQDDVNNENGEINDDDNEEQEAPEAADQPVDQQAAPGAAGPAPGGMALHAAHHALINQMGPTGFQPYNKPSFFAFRIFLLVHLLCLSLLGTSVLCLTLPVFLGRFFMSLWVGNGVVVHELYTAACGLYLCWLMCRLATMIWSWLPAGIDLILEKAKMYTILFVKSLLVAAMLLGVIPFLLGLLFEVVVVVPIRVPLDQSPVFFPWQDWALGVLHAKIMCAVTMMGPNWWLKTVLEQVYQDGFRNLNLGFIIRRVVLPVVTCLVLILTAPYAVAAGITPLLGLGDDINLLVVRRIYPCLVTSVVSMAALVFHLKQFKKLYEHIKNDKYLVGQQLVNYDPKEKAMKDGTTQTTAQKD
ncbi:E3 ubiquitin-protein ligase MARCHF6-like [Asterias amurensis]|uniref:E3 ubiquitin-protein ligase MARCHF6-like n=1 Tax=Asterias amurensis TaxID=7602 RepID=UPI003AB4DDD1